MEEKNIIKEIVDNLGSQKNEFLNEVQESVRLFISQQGSKCLSIVEKKDKNDKVWELSASVSYVGVLIKFCQGKRYNNNELDSYLTEPVIDRVIKKYQDFYQKNNEVLSEGIFKILSIKKDVIDSITKALIDNRITNSNVIKFALNNASKQLLHSAIVQKATHLISSQLQSLVHATTTNSISTPIVKTIGLLIIRLFAKQITVIIAKIVASTAFKTMIAAVLKKLLVALLVSAIVKAIAVKFGITMTAAWAVVLLPIIVGYIAYEITHFPGKLSIEVASKLRNELNGNFDKINDDVVNKLLLSFTTFELTGIITNLSNDVGLQSEIDKLIIEIINGNI